MHHGKRNGLQTKACSHWRFSALLIVLGEVVIFEPLKGPSNILLPYALMFAPFAPRNDHPSH